MAQVCPLVEDKQMRMLKSQEAQAHSPHQMTHTVPCNLILVQKRRYRHCFPMTLSLMSLEDLTTAYLDGKMAKMESVVGSITDHLALKELEV